VSDANDQPSVPPPPHWAVAEARDEAEDGETRATTIERARRLEREAEQLEGERHDEYDDPTLAAKGKWQDHADIPAAHRNPTPQHGE
jgi:hypothetical protein